MSWWRVLICAGLWRFCSCPRGRKLTRKSSSALHRMEHNMVRNQGNTGPSTRETSIVPLASVPSSQCGTLVTSQKTLRANASSCLKKPSKQIVSEPNEKLQKLVNMRRHRCVQKPSTRASSTCVYAIQASTYKLTPRRRAATYSQTFRDYRWRHVGASLRGRQRLSMLVTMTPSTWYLTHVNRVQNFTLDKIRSCTTCFTPSRISSFLQIVKLKLASRNHPSHRHQNQRSTRALQHSGTPPRAFCETLCYCTKNPTVSRSSCDPILAHAPTCAFASEIPMVDNTR